jgi:hypothetical protein
MAQMKNLTVRSLFQPVKEITGQTVHQYHMNLKLEWLCGHPDHKPHHTGYRSRLWFL